MLLKSEFMNNQLITHHVLIEKCTHLSISMVILLSGGAKMQANGGQDNQHTKRDIGPRIWFHVKRQNCS